VKNKQIDLALAFLESQPGSAASVLEQQPIEDVVEFIRDIPFAHAALVLEKMLPHYIASLCTHLDPSISASFLSKMDIIQVAAVMRNLDIGLRNDVLNFLSERKKTECKLLLYYVEEDIGAWMSTKVMTLPDDCSVREAILRIKKSRDLIDTDELFIVDRNRKLLGVVGVNNLLRANSDNSIISVMKQNPGAMLGRTSLVSAENHPLWIKHDTIAIVNANHQFMGTLRHLDLRKGLAAISNTVDKPNEGEGGTEIWGLYGTSLIALLDTVGEMAKQKSDKEDKYEN